MMLLVSELIHNARNRLVVVAQRIGAQGNDEAVAEIHSAALLLANAMALLRLVPGETLLDLNEVDLDEFYEELAAEAQRLVPRHLNMACHADFSACLFRFWTFDRQLVRLAVIDALMNAWRHAQNNVELVVTWRDGELDFAIRDDGPGFPESWLGLPAAMPRETTVRGTGQGLRLAREIAERHLSQERRGRVVLANEQGAVFRLCLP